jgi:hypothetical protein
MTYLATVSFCEGYCNVSSHLRGCQIWFNLPRLSEQKQLAHRRTYGEYLCVWVNLPITELGILVTPSDRACRLVMGDFVVLPQVC